MTFEALALSEPLLRAAAANGYQQPTEIQKRAIPIILQGRDLMASAQTGTGKTAAFVLPILERLARNPVRSHPGPRVLVLTPTRELATQVEQEVRKLSRYSRCTSGSIVGGVSYTPQERLLSQPVDILPLPEGIEIRPVDDTMIRQIFNAAAEAAQDHWNFVPPDEDDFAAWQDDTNFDPSLWMIAWEGDEVVGTVMNFINKEENQKFNRKRGYTENICTRRAWRKQGVASALLTHSIQMFIDMGMEETALGVDTENPSGALNIYKGVGYTEFERHITYRKPLS